MNEHKNKDSKLLLIMMEIKEEKKDRYSLHERPRGIFGRSTVPLESAS